MTVRLFAPAWLGWLLWFVLGALIAALGYPVTAAFLVVAALTVKLIRDLRRIFREVL